MMIDQRNDRKYDVPKTFIVVTGIYAAVAWGLFIAVVFA